MYLFAASIDFASFYDFDIWFLKCSDIVVFWNFSDIVVSFDFQFITLFCSMFCEEI